MPEKFPPYQALAAGGQGEIEEKKSRFIATLRPVRAEEETAAFLDEMRKTYWDARHNCMAFVIGQDARLTRCSDDGEPSGTAGRPMLETLLGAGLRDAAVVVTRYFGGTLLGTGGLARAYAAAVREGIAASRIVTMRYGVRLRIDTDYTGLGRVQHVLAALGIPVLESSYGERVCLTVTVPRETYERACAQLTEATAGRARLTALEEGYYESPQQ